MAFTSAICFRKAAEYKSILSLGLAFEAHAFFHPKLNHELFQVRLMPDILWILYFQWLFNVKLKTPFPQHKIKVKRWKCILFVQESGHPCWILSLVSVTSFLFFPLSNYLILCYWKTPNGDFEFFSISSPVTEVKAMQLTILKHPNLCLSLAGWIWQKNKTEGHQFDNQYCVCSIASNTST